MQIGHSGYAEGIGKSSALVFLVLCHAAFAQAGPGSSGNDAHTPLPPSTSALKPATFSLTGTLFDPAHGTRLGIKANRFFSSCTTSTCISRFFDLRAHPSDSRTFGDARTASGLGAISPDWPDGIGGVGGVGGVDNGAVRTAGAPAVSSDNEERIAENSSDHRLNLRLNTQRTYDARRGWGGLSYYSLNENRELRTRLPSGGLKYALYLDDCVRMEGTYGRASGADHYGLGMAMENWSVSVAGGASDRGISLQLGYSVPLGSNGPNSAARPAACGSAE